MKIENKKGSSISSLCKKIQIKFRDELFWIPGNGKQVKLWHDSITGKALIPCLPGIKLWLDRQGKFTLWDMSSWELDPPYCWIEWVLPDCPADLEEEKARFLE